MGLFSLALGHDDFKQTVWGGRIEGNFVPIGKRKNGQKNNWMPRLLNDGLT